MRKIHYLIIVLLCCVVPSIALAQVKSSCIARISTDPSLGIHSTAARSGGREGTGMGPYGYDGGGSYGGMGGYGGEMGSVPASSRSVIVDLIESYPVSGQAAREVFGMTLAELGGTLKINIYQTTPEVAMIGLSIHLVDGSLVPDDEEKTPVTIRAERFLAQTLENLRGVLRRMDDQIRESNDQPIAEAEVKLDELRRLVMELKDQARALHEETGTTALSLRDVMNQQQDMEQRIHRMAIELDVAQTMRDRLSQRVAEEARKAEEQVEQDETLGALHELQALKEEAYRRVMVAVEQGAASTAELDQAKAEMTEQRVRIAERRDMLKNNLQSGVLASLNNQLNDTLHESDNLQAMSQAYSSRLEQMKDKDLLGLAELYESIQEQLEDAERQMKHHADRLMKHKSIVESMLKPQVIVIE